jgi:hypothetical protein
MIWQAVPLPDWHGGPESPNETCATADAGDNVAVTPAIESKASD